MIPPTLDFLSAKISLCNREELKEFLIQTLYDKDRFRIILVDEKMMFSLLFNKELQGIVRSTEIVLCSSQTVAWMVKVLTGYAVPIIMPVTIFLDLMRIADEMGYTVFLFGGSKAISQETLKRMKKSFPQARIVGYYRSNVKQKELQDVLITIRKSSPQIFIASYKSGPKQEKWLTKNMQYFQNSIVVGVGDSFNVIAGRKKMPPMWFQKRGWNGFYHFLVQPYNIFRIFRLIVLFSVAIYTRIKYGIKR